jgi:hypothetical protein
MLASGCHLRRTLPGAALDRVRSIDFNLPREHRGRHRLASSSHLSTVPAWLREAARTEYDIKTGLVILGAGMLFDGLARGGLLSIVQAVLVVVAVWFVCFWLARRLRVDDESDLVSAGGRRSRSSAGRFSTWRGRSSWPTRFSEGTSSPCRRSSDGRRGGRALAVVL